MSPAKHHSPKNPPGSHITIYKFPWYLTGGLTRVFTVAAVKPPDTEIRSRPPGSGPLSGCVSLHCDTQRNGQEENVHL